MERLSFWYDDEIKDAAHIAGNLNKFEVFNDFLYDNSAQTKQKLGNYLRIISVEHGYEDIFIVTAKEEVVISANASRHEITKVLSNTINKALSTKNVAFSDIYICPDHKIPHLDIVSPAFSKDGQQEVFVVFRINPMTDVFPLFSYWPDSKYFHEIKLVRKVGDSISSLTYDDLLKDEPIIKTFFDDGMNSPSRKAAKGYQGIFEGRDQKQQTCQGGKPTV